MLRMDGDACVAVAAPVQCVGVLSCVRCAITSASALEGGWFSL